MTGARITKSIKRKSPVLPVVTERQVTKYLTNNTQQLNEITSCRTFNWL